MNITIILLLFVHLIVIFLLNGVLFSPYYFGDQFRYLFAAQTLRDQIFSLEYFNPNLIDSTHFGYGADLRIVFSSFLFSIFPFPYINSVYSLSMINYLIFIYIFIFFYKKKFSSNKINYFILLYPSILLYTSLALRETIIIFTMIISLYYIFFDRNLLIAIPTLFLLSIIKIQNFLIIILSYFIYIIIRKNHILNFGLFLIFALLIIFYGESVPLIKFIVTRIDYYRYNLIAENYGYDYSIFDSIDYKPFSLGFQFFPMVISSFFHMLFKPFPWNVENSFQLIQSIENFLLFLLMIYLFLKKYHLKKINDIFIFLHIFLFISMSLYGLVIFNYGTAARFRAPFVFVYLIFSLLLSNSNEIYLKSTLNKHH